jgi:hypothetical protein
MSSGVVLDSKAARESLKSGTGYLSSDDEGDWPVAWSLPTLCESDANPLGDNFAGARDLQELPIERRATVESIFFPSLACLLAIYTSSVVLDRFMTTVCVLLYYYPGMNRRQRSMVENFLDFARFLEK